MKPIASILTKKQALEQIDEKAVEVTGWTVIAALLITWLTFGTICIIYTIRDLCL